MFSSIVGSRRERFSQAIGLAFAVILCGCAEDTCMAGAESNDQCLVDARQLVSPSPQEQAVDAPDRIPLQIDGSFSPRERQNVLVAINAWNAALNHQLHFVPSVIELAHVGTAEPPQPGSWRIMKVDRHYPLLQAPRFARTLAVTIGRTSGVVYIVADRMHSGDLTPIMLHELGHVLGAPHLASGLMSPTFLAEQQRCIDREAMAVVANIHHLDMDRLTWCTLRSEETRS